MIPVRRVDHVLVAQLRVAALELGEDVLRLNRSHRVANRQRRPELERHRTEVTRESLFLERVEILAGLCQQLLRRVEREPAFDCGSAHVLVRRHEIESFAQIPLDDGERIACGPGLVDDEDAGGATPRALLELVRPATVIGHRRAVEQAGVELRRIGSDPAPVDR